MAGKAYAFTRRDAEWRQMLTPDQYDVMRAHGTEGPGSCALLLEKRPGRFHAPAVASRYSNRKGSSKGGLGGPASIIRSRVRSRHPLIEPSAWCEPRCTARIVVAILDMSLMTALRRPICATASTESR